MTSFDTICLLGTFSEIVRCKYATCVISFTNLFKRSIKNTIKYRFLPKRTKGNILYYTVQNTPSVIIGLMTLLCNYLYEIKGISFDDLAAVLQIRRDNRDNFGIIIHIFTAKTYFVTHH